VLAAAHVVGAQACSEGRTDGAVTVVDSAGIPITLSPDQGATYATLSADPVVSLGGPDADGPTLFYQITNIQLDADGRLWVSDWQSGELRVFARDGSHLRTLGGSGEGPGEFLGIRLLGFFADDSVAVADQRAARLTVYGQDGELARTVRLSDADGTVPRPFDVYPDGAVLGQIPAVRNAASLQEGELLVDPIRLARFTSDGVTPVVEVQGGGQWFYTERNVVPLPFTVNAAFDLVGEELHFAVGSSFRVRVYHGGRVVRMYGIERPPQPVTQRDVDAYRTLVVEAYPEERHEVMLSAFDHPATPEVLPAYVRLVAAEDGTVWVARFSSEDPWDVYGVAGDLLGGVRVPEDFIPMSIRGDRVAGVWLDELGIEYVQVYEVLR
jgi:hypothetical protein